MPRSSAGAEAAAKRKTWLREAGLRITTGRVAILAALEEARAPLTHASLLERIGGVVVDRATVYRGLADLVSAGLVSRTDVGDHVWRYELRRREGPGAVHPHFVCTRCGSVSCLPEGAVTLRLGAALSEHVGSEGVEVHVRGVCPRCAGRAPEA